MKRYRECRIEKINSIILYFPTSHYISNWRPVTRTIHIITFLQTNTGIIGMGEGTPYWTNIAEDYAKILSLAKSIQGLSLYDSLNKLRSMENIEFEIRRPINYGAYLALESAILNALSQCNKVKHEAELLGGIYRTEVPIAYTIFLNHPKTMAHRLRHAIKSGFRHIKFKIPCSLEMLEMLLKTMYTVIKQYSNEEYVLRADANECFYNLEKAMKALTIMEKYGVKIVEQPMHRDKLKDIVKLRKEFYPAIEIMLDESLRRPSDIELFAQIEVADSINFHPSKLGCLTITRKAILKTQKLGMKANIGSALMTEIGLYHYLNLAASIPRLDYPLEELGIYNVYGYSIIRNPLDIIEGKIILHNIDISDLDFNLMKQFIMKRSHTNIFKEALIRLMKYMQK